MPDGRTEPLQKHQRLYVLGALLIVVGLAAGLLPVLSSGGVDCGAGWYATDEVHAEMDAAVSAFSGTAAGSGCEDLRSTVRLAAIGVLVVGLALAVGGWVSSPAGRRDEGPPPA